MLGTLWSWLTQKPKTEDTHEETSPKAKNKKNNDASEKTSSTLEEELIDEETKEIDKEIKNLEEDVTKAIDQFSLNFIKEIITGFSTRYNYSVSKWLTIPTHPFGSYVTLMEFINPNSQGTNSYGKGISLEHNGNKQYTFKMYFPDERIKALFYEVLVKHGGSIIQDNSNNTPESTSEGFFSRIFPDANTRNIYLFCKFSFDENRVGIPAEKPFTISAQKPKIETPSKESPQTKTNSSTDKALEWTNPKSIVSYLDQYVVGQEEAKKIVAVAFSNYMLKLNNPEVPKDNLLLIGPSGVGKTYMISLLAKKGNLPWINSNLTGKSSEGYKGENLSAVFEQLKLQTKDKAPYGIIFLDEIDKLARDNWGSGSGFGTRLQDELIGWLEEATVLGSESNAIQLAGKNTGINTKNLLFVVAGAFYGDGTSLEDIIRKRLHKGKARIGFGHEIGESVEKDLLFKTRPEDLISYGLKPELVGRLPAIGVLHQLSTDEKINILSQVKESILSKYLALLSAKGYAAEVVPESLKLIAERCPYETGARGLHALCNNLFTKIQYSPENFAQDNKIKITPELVTDLVDLYR